MPDQALISWSGGKDAALALHHARRRPDLAITHLLTDDAGQYRHMHRHFASHATTPHQKGIYVDPTNPLIHTNTVEGSFSIFKRGMKGVYQHCGEQHLHRYLAEFEFRYNHRIANGVDDKARTVEGLKGIVGKRITYRRPDDVA